MAVGRFSGAPGRRFSADIVGLFEAFHDPQIALGGLAENLECGLISLAVMGRKSLRDALKLDDDDALGDAGLVGFGRIAADQEASATGVDRRTRQLGICRQGVRVREPTGRWRPNTL